MPSCRSVLSLEFNGTEYIPLSDSRPSNMQAVSPMSTTDQFEIVMRGDASVTPLLFVPNLDPDIQPFIDRHALWPAVFVGQRLGHELRQTIPEVMMSFKVERDPEARDREELIIIYSVPNKTYHEILNIWDDVSEKMHRALPATISERVYVRLLKT